MEHRVVRCADLGREARELYSLTHPQLPPRIAAAASYLPARLSITSLQSKHGQHVLSGLRADGYGIATQREYYRALKQMLALLDVSIAKWPKAPRLPRRKR